MTKFSDSNYDILEEYFTEILGDIALGEGDSWLHGPKSGIVVDGNIAETLYEDNASRGFVAHEFIIKEIDGNKFKMEYSRLVSTFSLASSAFEIGNDMYFRKDSAFYTYLQNNSEEFRNYVNTERTFCYFGKIWPITNEQGLYNIEFQGMKDYMTNALPLHNRTEKLTELITLWFDNVNHEPYNMTKYQWSLLDAREVDTRWLQYIANIYGIEINDDLLTELPLREWVDFLIYFLKRIGSYNALYVVWNVFASQSTNAFNVYERWDEWCRAHNPDATDIPSFSEFPNFHPGITSRQYDFHWLEEYGVTPSGGSGDEWYAQFVPSGFYPYPSTPYPTHALETPSAGCASSSASASMVLSPHYVVEVDLSTQPLGDLRNSDEIMSEIRATELVRNWEYTKPTGKYVQYQELIAPLAQEDRTGQSINLYPQTSLGYCETYYTGSQYIVNDSPTPSGGQQVYVHIQNYDSNKWTFTHSLSGDVMCQVWEKVGTEYERTIPEEITVLSDVAIQIDFGEAIDGIAVVAGELPPITNTYTEVGAATPWSVTHGLGTAAPSAYTSGTNTNYWNTSVKNMPLTNTLTTGDITTATWNPAINGYAFSRLADYEHTQAVSATTWNIVHGMNTFGPITQIFNTSDQEIQPDAVTCVDSDNMEITFESAQSGKAQLIYAPRDYISVCNDEEDIMDSCISPNLGWWEVGNGPTEEYDPFATGQLESTTASGAYWRVWEDSVTWYIDFIVPEGENLSITEVGLFNSEGIMLYYTKCSELYKTEEMQTVFHYRSQKLEQTESSSSSSSSLSSSSSSSSESSNSSTSSSSSSISASSSSSSQSVTSFAPLSGPDDGYVCVVGGCSFTNTGNGVQLGAGASAPFRTWAWSRWDNVTIPAGSTIESAIIRFNAASDGSNNWCNIRLVFEYADDPNAPIDLTDLTSRTYTDSLGTSGYEEMTHIPAWTDDVKYDSPQMASVLQHVIDRGGWNSGQAIMAVFKNDPLNNSTNNALRIASTYEAEQITPTSHAIRLIVSWH